MFDFVIIAFIKYILHIILRSLVWNCSVLSSLALRMGKEYSEGRWFGGQGAVGMGYDVLP